MSRKKKEEKIEGFDPDHYSRTAVQWSMQFTKSKLDYSDRSILLLEDIMEASYHELKNSEVYSNEKIWKIAYVWGAYLGQTILRNIAGEYNWCIRDGLPVLCNEKGNIMSPISKVYKRLVYGAGESVLMFYDFSSIVAQMM